VRSSVISSCLLKPVQRDGPPPVIPLRLHRATRDVGDPVGPLLLRSSGWNQWSGWPGRADDLMVSLSSHGKIVGFCRVLCNLPNIDPHRPSPATSQERSMFVGASRFSPSAFAVDNYKAESETRGASCPASNLTITSSSCRSRRPLRLLSSKRCACSFVCGRLGNSTLNMVQNKTTVVQEVPIQTPGENEILVRVRAIAINPTDWKRMWFFLPIRRASIHPLIAQAQN
jgi:hypothetical protein